MGQWITWPCPLLVELPSEHNHWKHPAPAPMEAANLLQEMPHVIIYYPERLWLPHLQNFSRSGWMGPWANWMSFKLPSNTTHFMVLGFYNHSWATSGCSSCWRSTAHRAAALPAEGSSDSSEHCVLQCSHGMHLLPMPCPAGGMQQEQAPHPALHRPPGKMPLIKSQEPELFYWKYLPAFPRYCWKSLLEQGWDSPWLECRCLSPAAHREKSRCWQKLLGLW